MTNQPPQAINGSTVVLYSKIDHRHCATGNCRHIVGGTPQLPFVGLAICRCEEENCFYLYYCDSDWNEITDTWHQTLVGATHQAEFEFEGISNTWQRPTSDTDAISGDTNV
jgi:hypothetical protein